MMIRKDRLATNARIFFNLTRRDLTVQKKGFVSDLINIITWPASLAVSFGYVLPAVGMAPEMGSFLLIGSLATTFFYLSIGMASDLVNDFTSFRFIDSQLVIPITSHKVLLFQRVCSFSLSSVMLSIPILPIGKFLLGSRLDLSHFSLLKFTLMIVACSVFFGFFALFLAAIIDSNRMLSNIWRRLYTPMQLLGCYWFSLENGYKVFSTPTYLMLLNPLTCMTEGIRGSVFGQEGYFNVWAALGLLIFYTSLLAGYSFSRLKRRLDLL